MSDTRLEIDHAGRRAVVRKNERHPERYLWIDLEGREFFLGVLTDGMTRGDVRRMAERWLNEHARHLAT